MKGPVVLGIDGGGTKTLAIAMEAIGAPDPESPKGVAGPSNIAAMDPEAAGRAVIASGDQALRCGGWTRKDVASVCAAVAGYSHEENRRRLLGQVQAAFPSAVCLLQPDYVAAYDGALAGRPGAVVIAGTGQVAYGEDGSGRGARAGGYGHLIDDAGSGYGVGRAAIAAVLKDWDSIGPQTALTVTLGQLLNVSNSQEMIAGVYGGSIDRLRIASLARTVSDAAVMGDVVAVRLLQDAGRSLAGIAISVISRLWAPAEPVEAATAGSLWSSLFLFDEFERELRARLPNVKIIEPHFDPVVGAALRAMRQLDTRYDSAVN